ncbi:hypothetical protein BDV36DRAFT_244655 [Aspergillus pseudocaelatus]|uniref:Uncharacterized protein n=1 Tax=Aspergillus pseudocaelatus TaxID=1825620 RepID=A0ABQ6X3V7_9EURO|nr:hypothetical protein BDV36DRAFT_244655 [Aspergillus pseudocaelatus]
MTNSFVGTKPSDQCRSWFHGYRAASLVRGVVLRSMRGEASAELRPSYQRGIAHGVT